MVHQELRHDVSKPLRDLAANPPALAQVQQEADQLKVIPLPSGFKPATEPDAALQRTAALAPTAAAPTLNLNFEGLGVGFPNFQVFFVPPDPNGAVGKTQYVQWVNTSFAVFDKATGNVLPNFPVPGNTLWQGFGGSCETDNSGDPIVTYDKLADRWVFAQQAFDAQAFEQCVAVSTSSDATGTYNRYAFSYSNLNDYPKLGVWPDAYYLTFNIFSGTTFQGAEACAYDRNAMLSGQPATQVCFPPDSSVLGLLPSDVDGLNPPPAGEPNFMLSFGVNALNLFKFHVDFGTPANSSLTGPTSISVQPFTPLCNGASRACVPQPQPPGDGTLLDTLSDRLMYRLAYRNFGDHESLVVNHTVIADPTALNTGVRWYEIQNPNGNPTVAQQSTFAPDSNFRWMGSAAMDVSGDMAVGYSVSSSTVFPSIAVAGRAATDPANTLQAEATIFSGTGAQISVNFVAPLTRWGDYTAMQVDPVDDCTFWYTNEYLAATGIPKNSDFNWNTRIANFKFPGCGAPLLNLALSHAGNFTQGQTGATNAITVTNSGAAATDGTDITVSDTLPSGLTATVASGAGWTCPTVGSTVSCTRNPIDTLGAGQSYPPITVTVNVAADAAPQVTNTATVSGGGDKDFVHNTTSDPIRVTQTGPDLTITKSHSGTFTQGQTGTYTITVTNVGLSATDGTPITVTDTLPAGLTYNAATGTNWTCPPAATNVTTVTCTNATVLAAGSMSVITLIANVTAIAPATLVNTASVAGGGDVNPLNNTASNPTTIVPPPADLTITKSHIGNFTQGQQNAEYFLTVTNVSGGPTVGAVTVTDTLPAGLTALRSRLFGWSCTVNTPVNVTCTRSDILAVGRSYPPIRLGVNVADNAAASVVNTATVSGGGDVTPGNDTATDTTAINPAPGLTVSMSHTPDPMIVGQTGTYTIAVNNVGGAPTVGLVNVSDNLPVGLNVTSATGTGWSCNTSQSSSSSSVSCVRADSLAAGAAYPAITMTVSVNGGGPSVTNTVTVSGGGGLSNGSASDLTHVTAPVLAIAKTHSGSFTVGSSGIYVITVGNTGPIATAGAVAVQDSFPSGLTLASASGTDWSCAPLLTIGVTCVNSDVIQPNGTYPPLNITVNIGNTGASVVNTATVQGGGDTTQHSASDATSITAPALAVTKTHSGNFVVGQTGIYQITVSNTGKVGTVGTVTLQDTLPPNSLTAVAAGGPGWNCSSLPTSSLTCTRSDLLGPGASYPTLILTVNVLSAASTVTNTVSVTGGGDASTHNASDTAQVTGPTLSIAKSHSGTFTSGQNGTYTINIGNTGSLATIGTVTVQDLLPSGLTATAVSGAGWNCSTLPTTQLSCTRSDSLNPGSAYPPLSVTVSVAASGTITNTATVTGGGDAANHSATDSVAINPGPSLVITKTHVDPFTLGQIGTYTITVSNNGKLATSGVVTVQDSLPAGFTATASSGTGWNCNAPPTTSVICTRSDVLNPGGGTYPPLTLTVSVNGSTPAVFNVASVSGGGDPQTHLAEDPTTVIGPSLGATKSHSPDPFVVGQTGTYTITVDNKAGKGPTEGTITMQDSLPPGLTATTITGSGWACSTAPGNLVTCTRSDSLAPGGSYPPISVTVNVNSGGPAVTNSALVQGGEAVFFAVGSDTAKVIAAVLSITEAHSPDPFVAGQQGIYTITVGNTGTVSTTGTVTVTDSMPAGLALASSSGTGWSCTPPGVATVTVLCTRSDALAPGASYPPLVLTANLVNPLATIVNKVAVNGGGDALTHSASDAINVTTPLLAITKTHSGNFSVGQSGTYTITVSNVGKVATAGTVTVTDNLPLSELTATSISGAGWGCNPLPTSSLVCTRADSLAASQSYPPLTVTVSVAGGAGNIINTATVTGGGDGLTHNANDPTTINTPALALSNTHNGTFTVGQPASYTIMVSNSGTAATSGVVTVLDTLPPGLTATSVAGTGWSCPTGPNITSIDCTRSDTLAGGGTYPPIIVTATLDPAVQAFLVNSASVEGGGDPIVHTVTDTAPVSFPDLAVNVGHAGNFFVGEAGAAYTINVSNVGSIATAGGTITVADILPVGLMATAASGTGWSCNIFSGPQTEVDCTRPAGTLSPGSSYPPISVTANVALSAPAALANFVSLFGIGDSILSNNAASDPTTILPIAIIATSNTSVTVTAGSSGTYSFQVNLGTNPSPGTSTFSVTGLPANSTATFAPSSLSQTGAVTVTVNTSGNGHVASLRHLGFGWFAPICAAVLVPVLGLLLMGISNKHQRKWAWLGVSVCALFLVASFAGCGGGSGPGTPAPTPTPTPMPTPTPTPPPSTPPGTYTLTVTATTPNATASKQVTLVVQ
jgi:uncharacterized repeat protein (TIGR01451 family)